MKDSKLAKAGKNLPIQDSAEALIDTFITSGALSALPIAATAVGLFKSLQYYKTEKLKAKLDNFVNGTGDLKKTEIDKFLASRKPDDDPLLAEHLLELIEKAESEQKAMIIGVLFRRLVRGKIDRDHFSDQVRFVNNIYIVDLFKFMHGYHNPELLRESLGDVLVNHGICKRSVDLAYRRKNMLKQEREQYIQVNYEITGMGKLSLKSLHDAYRDKIEGEHLLKD